MDLSNELPKTKWWRAAVEHVLFGEDLLSVRDRMKLKEHDYAPVVDRVTELRLLLPDIHGLPGSLQRTRVRNLIRALP